MNKTIVLASGGTGGHIFPAYALAEELINQDYRVILITDKRSKKYLKESERLELYFVSAASMRRGYMCRIMSILKLTIGTITALFELAKIKPALVVGFGGYPSFPTLMAAKLLRLDVIIHEQNSVLGKVNRYFSSYAKIIATSFPDVIAVKDADKQKVVFCGNPIRRKMRDVSKIPYNAPIPGGKLSILVIGGSQGAHIFTKVLPEALAKLSIEERSRIIISQQCRQGEIKELGTKYKELSVNAELTLFFNDIHKKFAEAHLIISRAGASTVAELTVTSRPAILVPYPYATSNHQMYNATTIADKRAGFLIPQDVFNADTLSAKLEEFLNDPTLLIKASNNAEKCYPDAAEKLSELIQGVLNKTSH
ncbi:UDP-N-acetylglucosamine--N-acetylmuramyl- (pentapeptide) pyrophosphoryl-undecaprenol N-acetylglucosamine transferase [Rickettsiales bacterium Ac37b]|nr:UDP-N-acetylglucosamine--N-acetylmuramyl- (pentapeptide) pyrophosphoryl-undecaprenol N-acetylglucosamine transferase [Rickettsiales bacterium Ac37b]